MSAGDEMEAVVLTLDREERKMSLGIKQLSEDPWTKQDVLTKYAIGTNHKGIVRNLTNFGLFIELEEGIDGLVHVSDLSWTKKVKHPSEFVKVGEELEVQVLELDIESRRLALGHKQLEENPWDTFETVFELDSVHKCTVISKNDKGATLELPYGLEGFATIRNLKKEDGSNVEVGETLDFVVTEFSKEDKRIVLSHTNIHTKPAGKPAAKKGGGAGSAVKKINQEAEKSTLGDLDALTALKEQMEDNAKKAAKKTAPKAKKEEKVEEAPIAEEPVKEEAPKKATKAKASAEEAVAEAPAEEAEEKPKKTAAKPKAKKATPKAEETAEEAPKADASDEDKAE